MKNILLGSTVLVGTAALFAGAAVANDTPTVTLGGYSDFQVGYVSESRQNDSAVRNGAFYQETELSVKVDAKADNGLGYGAYMDLDVSNTNNQDGTNDQVGKSYVYLEGSWGRLEGGSNYGVTKTMKIDASSIARASGGIDGNFNSFMTATSGTVLATPDLVLDYGATQFGDESQEAINKVNYYTPRFAGFQAGISYLFDTTGADRGTGITRTDYSAAANGEAENVFLGGINYEGEFEGVSFGLAATGEWGQSESINTNDLSSWNLGGKVGLWGLTLAGSYGDLGESLSTVAIATKTDTTYWTAGASYEYGPYGASVTYLNSTTETISGDNEFQNLSFGVDYALAPGLTPYAELNLINMGISGFTGQIPNSNNATVFIAGTQLAF